MKKPLSKDVYIYLSEFRYQLRKFLNFSESAAREVGITPQQHQLLLAIMGFPNRNAATPRELAERLQITHHSCVGLIDRCEQLELVHRKKNPADGRSVLVELTSKGEKILERLSEVHLEEINRIQFLKKFDEN
ncbi:MarR family transcriptional regulator [Pullulanibacillus sp. KACC 23026]|uniref:MarR family winged helix-turn-helix transcriptional regulator n=1 Tax=Pullulanibacillus sp. KACC 23026 TaxID=3028315 RepID=UPI0023B0D2DB|nr:MarR family transcriptional regulator [Pullulanibacillus sp. KACC 23026]WEG13283.1 MarR family transcriptional regulator [Pullulanibacillus sp. KACC 23026]